MTKKDRPTTTSKLLQKILLGVIACGGLFYAYTHLDRLPKTKDINSENIEVRISEEEKISFTELCKRNPVSTCFDNSQTTDFLYADDKQIAVIKNEEFSPELFEEAIEADAIGEWLEHNVDFTLPPHNTEAFAQLQQHNQDIIEQLYEEELPEDIIDISTSSISNPKLQGREILPSRKPPYFGEKPVIVMVIDDMGISHKRTADIASLQAPITASFLTYGRNLEQQIANSIAAGHEIMIHVPMEAQSTKDAAPDVLTTQMSPHEIQNNLALMLSKFKDVKGINNHMGSKLTEDKSRMMAIMETLKQYNLFFLDSKTSPNSQAEDAAAEIGIAYAHRHVFIDNNNDKEYILGQLSIAEKLAHRNGYAIAIGHPKSQTYEALKEWLPSLDEKGIILEPLSKIVNILHPIKK